jgi:hypothetical protein
MTEPTTDTQTDTPAADRLVIRITLDTYEEPAAPPPPPRTNKGVLLGVAAVVVALLGWFGIGSLRSDPPPPPAAIAQAPIVAAVPPTTTMTPAKPVEPEVQPQPDAPTAAINEVIPDASRSALQTIRGTVRVAVLVTIDNQGSVVATTATDPGPSLASPERQPSNGPSRRQRCKSGEPS